MLIQADALATKEKDGVFVRHGLGVNDVALMTFECKAIMARWTAQLHPPRASANGDRPGLTCLVVRRLKVEIL